MHKKLHEKGNDDEQTSSIMKHFEIEDEQDEKRKAELQSESEKMV